MRGDKRAISPIIGTIILVGFTLAASAIYFLWVKNIIDRTQLQTLEEKTCFDTNIRVSDFCHENLEIMNIETGISEEKTRIKFTAENNNPNIPIEGFIIQLDYGNGNFFPISTVMESEMGSLIAKRIISDFIQNPENIKKIDVFPKITYENNKTLVCNKKGIYFYWEAMEQC